jgi:hypothetical protein
VFYSNTKNLERCRHNGAKCNWPWEKYLPKDSWPQLARVASDQKMSGIILRWFGLDEMLPRDIFDRLDNPNPGGTFYLTT